MVANGFPTKYVEQIEYRIEHTAFSSETFETLES